MLHINTYVCSTYFSYRNSIFESFAIYNHSNNNPTTSAVCVRISAAIILLLDINTFIHYVYLSRSPANQPVTFFIQWKFTIQLIAVYLWHVRFRKNEIKKNEFSNYLFRLTFRICVIYSIDLYIAVSVSLCDFNAFNACNAPSRVILHKNILSPWKWKHPLQDEQNMNK